MANCSIVKIFWKDIREEVRALNPELSEIIDKIAPAHKYPLYRARYPYGFEILKNGKLYIPTKLGVKPIDDDSVSTDLQNDLMYNSGTSPVSLSLKNCTEIYLEQSTHTIPLYGLIHPGKIFSTWRVLNTEKSHAPAFLWQMTSGARSIFMLPKISETLRHNKIKKELEISCEKPRTLFDQWRVFKGIANSNITDDPWSSEILFFSGKWFKNLHDPAWSMFYKHLLETAWGGSEYLRNLFTWNTVYSMIQQKLDIKPNPYVADITKHLIAMGVQEMPGFAPANTDNIAPISLIQSVYEDIYGLERYAPIVLAPSFVDKNNPIYYSLEYPTALEFSPPSRANASKIHNLFEIGALIKKYLKVLSDNTLNLQQTPIGDLDSNVQYDLFHTDPENYSTISSTKKLFEEDPTFRVGKYSNSELPESALFLRGCVRIKLK